MVSSGEGSSAAESAEPGDSSPASATDTAAASGQGSAEGDANSEYCRAVRGEIEMPADIGALGSVDFTDSVAVQEMLADAEANLSKAVSIAPESLRADFQVVLESSMSMVSELVENGGDYSALESTSLENPEFVAAAERVDRYNVEVCGYDAATATVPAVDPSTMTATIESMLAPLQAQLNLSDEQVTCVSEKMASSMIDAGGAPDLSAVMTFFTECGIDAAAGG